MKSGIYAIVAPSGNCYVGSSKNLRGRLSTHKNHLKKGMHGCQGLQRAANKYGIENLEFRVLLVCAEADLVFYEQRALDILKPKYNRRKVADRNSGLIVSIETRAKIGKAHRGRKLSDEHKASLSKAGRGRPKTLEHSRKIGDAQIGRVFSSETRAKMSAAKRGKSASPACLRAVSEYWSGRSHSPETRAKMSVSAKARWALQNTASEEDQ